MMELPPELSLREMELDEFAAEQNGSSVSSLRSQQVPPHTPLLPPRVSTHSYKEQRPQRRARWRQELTTLRG